MIHRERKDQKMEFFATAIPGTEKALRDELSELGFKSTRLNRGGIPFIGELEDGWRACLLSRIAQRIHLVLSRYQAQDEKALYEGAREVDWSLFLSPEHTLSVSAFCHSSNLTHSAFISQKIKDAIVDRLREQYGERPNVDRDDPDVRVFVYLAKNKATLYVDLSGDALFQRGYRLEKGDAPIKENLAAAMLRLSGWDRKSPICDPMCGSGTIVIEAALWARNVAPGIFRERFGFERWANYDDAAGDSMRRLRGEARRNANGDMPKILASDIDQEVLDRASSNAKRAGVRIKFTQADVAETRFDGMRRFVVTNPPFNERIQVNSDFYRKLGAAMSRLHGCRVGIICEHNEPMKHIPVKETEVFELKNGNLDCFFSLFDIP